MSEKKKIRNFFKSLKIRLALLFILIGILPSTVLRIGILNAYEKKAVSNRSIDVLSQAKILTNQIMFHDYLKDVTSEVINSQLNQLSKIYDGRIMVIDDTFRIIKDTYGLDEGKAIISEEVMRSFKGEEISKYDSHNCYIEMALPLSHPESKEIQGVLLVSVSTDSILLNQEYLQSRAWIVELSSSLVLVFLAVVLAQILVKPFHRMAKGIMDIQDGYQAELNEHTYMETEYISNQFNQLFKKMKVIDNAREEFVSNVSHELKTPLTSMKVLADSLNGQEDVPVELYKEFMLDIGNEIDRETKIINDLLSLVKMDRSAGDLNISAVNINELIELILKRLRPIAEKQHVELVLESFRPVSAEVDEVKLTLALTNLIENGIKYNKPEGWVQVSLNADHQYFYVKVEDSGMGIPEDSLENIFERFYRVDKSHSREIGGSGLGLAITRNSILMHRGAIKVFSTEGEGTIFHLRRKDMKAIHRNLICLLLFVCVFGICGCSKESQEDSAYHVYYLNKENTKIVKRPYEPTAAEDNSSEMIEEFLMQLGTDSGDVDYKKPLSDEIRVIEYSLEESLLTLYFDNTYSSMDRMTEVLTRAAVVRTMMQVPGVECLTFYVGDSPLSDKNGNPIGVMSNESFVENPGEQINSIQTATLNLYFANEKGNGLVKETQNVHYSSNISLEKLVMEHLLEGPTEEGARSAIPQGTKLMSVSVADGVCFVSLDDNFLHQDYSVEEPIVMYSIINSLSELTTISKVQISVNGETKGVYRDSFEFGELYERNLDYVDTD